MTDLAQAVVPFALAGAFLPTWTVFVIVLLGTDRPLANSLSFVAGNAAFRLALGIGALLSIEIPSVPGPGDELSRGQAIAMATSALIALVLGLLQLRRPDDPDRPLPNWMRRFERLRPALSFALGVITVASPGIQWVYLLGAVAIIQDQTASMPAALLSLLVFVVGLQVMLLVPIGIYAMRPERAHAVLERMKLWINGHANRVTGIILVSLAIYFGYRSAGVLLG